MHVVPDRAALVRLREDAQTESFQALYRTRAPVIEGRFGEGKQWHGLRRAWRRGLSNMRVQCYLIAAVLNCKRLIAAIRPLWAPVHTCRLFLTVHQWLSRHHSALILKFHQAEATSAIIS